MEKEIGKGSYPVKVGATAIFNIFNFIFVVCSVKGERERTGYLKPLI
jgi:hypothetical protein